MPTTTFTYKHPDGTTEAVDGEPWFWVARYRDGTLLQQFDPRDRGFHRFAEIDLGELLVFSVHCAYDAKRAYSVHIRPGMRPIFFKRHQRLHVGTPAETRQVLFCFGYQETVGGRNVKCLLTIWPDGSVSVENTDGR